MGARILRLICPWILDWSGSCWMVLRNGMSRLRTPTSTTCVSGTGIPVRLGRGKIAFDASHCGKSGARHICIGGLCNGWSLTCLNATGTGEPPLAQHHDECSQQRDQETHIHYACDCDNLARWVFLDIWNSWSFAQNCRVIEGEEEGTEGDHGLAVWVRLKFQLDINNKSQADCRR